MIVRFLLVVILLPVTVVAADLRSASVVYEGGAATYQVSASQHVICDDCPAREKLAPAVVTVSVTGSQSFAPEKLTVEGTIPFPFSSMPAHVPTTNPPLPLLQASHIHVSPLATVYFTLNSSRLVSVEKRRLREAVASGIDSDVIIRAEGHSCKIGKAAYTRKLSLRRARAVSAYLQSLGVSVREVVGLGKSHPLSGPLSKSRRVEVVIKERN